VDIVVCEQNAVNIVRNGELTFQLLPSSSLTAFSMFRPLGGIVYVRNEQDAGYFRDLWTPNSRLSQLPEVPRMTILS
jgi:hypothetical protein